MKRDERTGFTTTTKHPHTVDLLIERLENLPVSDYHGLDSPGLTCYLNSVLQVLFMTNDFREAVRRCCSEYSMDRHLRQLFIDLERKMTTTHKITEKLGIRNVYKQRDAAECFEKILCRTSPEASKIFKGELNHKTTCNVCNKKNDSRSSFWLLPLAVVESHRETFNVGQGLKDFFKEQTVHGDNQMYCNRCDKKQNAHIKPELTQNPDVLTLLLKRFAFDYKRQCYVKVHCTADVPQTLYLEQCTYDLYAVVNHFGGLSGGHYTAEIKSFENGNWYFFNDNTVKNLRRQPFKAQEVSLRSHTAYLLMYKKVNKKLGKTDGRDQDVLSAHSDIEAERRQDTDKEKETQLQIGGCIGGVNHVVYDHSPVNTTWGKHTNHPVEPDCFQQKKTFPLKDNEANGFSMQTQKLHFAKRQKNGDHHELNGWQLCTNSKKHGCHLNTEGTLAVNLRMHQENHNTQKKRPKVNKAFYETQDGTGTKTRTKPDGGSARETVNPAETKCVKQKVEVELKGKNLKQRKEARVSDVSDSGVKSNSSASVPSWAGRSHSQSRMNRPTEWTHSPDRRSSSLKRNKVKTQHATQTVTKEESLIKKREAKRCEDKSVRPQWR